MKTEYSYDWDLNITHPARPTKDFGESGTGGLLMLAVIILLIYMGVPQ